MSGQQLFTALTTVAADTTARWNGVPVNQHLQARHGVQFRSQLWVPEAARNIAARCTSHVLRHMAPIAMELDVTSAIVSCSAMVFVDCRFWAAATCLPAETLHTLRQL